MNRGSRVIACNSPYEQGGMGQHFAQLVEDTRSAGRLAQYIAPGIKGNDPLGREIQPRLVPLLAYTPLRFLPRVKMHVSNELYDRTVASVLPRARCFMGFAGVSLHSFHEAEQLSYETLELVAANSHVENVQALHARAAQESGLRDTWLGRSQIAKMRREYEMADVIYVHSEYVRNSFVAGGIAPTKLRRMTLRVPTRFQPPATRPHDGTFRVVYVGRLETTKGLHILLEAFQALPHDDKELTLVGGWSSRNGRAYLHARMHDDARIVLAPGDPLPALHAADVFVHPSYEDGFGYAPMEALACGVPAIVTEETGMKEYVREGENGYVVPIGSVEAVVDRLQSLLKNPLASTGSLIPADLSYSVGPAVPSH